jgi:hypothetical protein
MPVTLSCENLAKCGFFQKHAATRKIACRGFIHMFCQGGRQHECKRKEYVREHGEAPSDDMLPDGNMLSL